MPPESDPGCIRAGKMDRKFMDARGVKWASQVKCLVIINVQGIFIGI
jgi:hypothetical protein